MSHAPSPTPGTPTPTKKPTKGPTPQATTAAPVAAPIRPVLVLNNSRVKGLADRSARTFRAGGWPVSGTGNYSGGTIARTTIYFAPGQEASAQRFAEPTGSDSSILTPVIHSAASGSARLLGSPQTTGSPHAIASWMTNG